jgi:hypothetical protein
MKLKHRIRAKILEHFAGRTEPSTLRAVRKAIDASVEAAEPDLADKQTRKASIVVELEKLIEKGVLSRDDDNDELTLVDNKDRTQKRKALEESLSDDKKGGDYADENKRKRSKSASGSLGPGADGEHNGTAQLVPASAVTVPQAAGINTILLFYAYCNPIMTRSEQDDAIAFCTRVLKGNGCSGRLRVGKEVTHLC